MIRTGGGSMRNGGDSPGWLLVILAAAILVACTIASALTATGQEAPPAPTGAASLTLRIETLLGATAEDEPRGAVLERLRQRMATVLGIACEPQLSMRTHPDDARLVEVTAWCPEPSR